MKNIVYCFLYFYETLNTMFTFEFERELEKFFITNFWNWYNHCTCAHEFWWSGICSRRHRNFLLKNRSFDFDFFYLHIYIFSRRSFCCTIWWIGRLNNFFVVKKLEENKISHCGLIVRFHLFKRIVRIYGIFYNEKHLF